MNEDISFTFDGKIASENKMDFYELYQGALRLTHAGDSQADENLIRRCRHVEACDGGSDWGSI